MFDDFTLTSMQLADQSCVEIAAGIYSDGTKVPLISEPAMSHRINLATVNRAIVLLVEQGVLIKRRGIGTSVAGGARLHLTEEWCQALVDRYVRLLIAEMAALGISERELIVLIQKKVNP